MQYFVYLNLKTSRDGICQGELRGIRNTPVAERLHSAASTARLTTHQVLFVKGLLVSKHTQMKKTLSIMEDQD